MSRALNFTSKVLGPKAVEQLRAGKVRQTVRSMVEAAPFLTKRGCNVDIALDGAVLYQAELTSVKLRRLADLDQFDAELGGFDSLYLLRDALRRAGFRFRPFEEYEDFAIQFQKVREDPA